MEEFLKIDENINLLLPDELLILFKFDFTDPEHFGKLKYKCPPYIFNTR